MSLLSFSLSLLLLSCWAFTPPLLQQRTFSNFYAATEPNYWPCSHDQLNIIGSAIGDAHVLAQAAANALYINRAERAPSFRKWFGPGMSYILLQLSVLTTSLLWPQYANYI